MTEQRINIPISNLLLIVATGLLLVLLWQLRSLIVTLMIAVVLAASIVPVVNWAERYRIPRWVAAIATYLLLIATLIGFALLIGPTVIEQIDRLIRQLPIYVEILRALIESLAARLSNSPELVSQFFNTQALTTWVIRSTQQLLLRSYGITKGIVGSFFTLILAILLSGYMVADSRTLIKSLVRLFPQPWDERLQAQVEPVSERMGGYIRGRLLVSAILSLATTIGLSILGLGEFAFGLGAIAGVTNLIPFLGPILGTVPALIVAISKGGWLFLWVLILFVILQNVETYVLDPLLVGSSVGVHPLYQLLAVLGGVQVLGIIGALIVPPWFAGVSVLVENLYLKPKIRAERRDSLRKECPEGYAASQTIN
ncbi:MAG: AI-2E family transporter [Oscillatoriaceae bacterium SKW80]|nr:AI-2E family transporter [Oscillatoriaceae bacterium SKYG93]MCX8121324.1 AI-2E family transporter [Oscillatoriaceae bacterium SKW80]MDW8453342.1 AI-2E family transporter [Oscillatoriaceae cyanobacterium SKYGB_i_bin93]HIK26696.1 AI-2E family transporter [Oscillatoriaceae cyanobacterium M7585_C2015_266]